ncbi:MAG TPA: RecX family transcriptional regulator [Croceibacterium sp.]|nr:RecX family transcriptional regulator [Croceibacterium sp.]
MSDTSSRSDRRKRPPKPLDSARLGEIALAYVARFSTTAANLERYLRRKLRERGWEGEGEPRIEELVERYAELGYIDDEAFARARSGSLLRRGYGERRVRQALGQAGIEEGLRERMRPAEGETRRAALALARRRRFGPFGAVPLDKALREKQIAAMLRAGHPLDSARQIVDAASAAEAEQWEAEADDEKEF